VTVELGRHNINMGPPTARTVLRLGGCIRIKYAN